MARTVMARTVMARKTHNKQNRWTKYTINFELHVYSFCVLLRDLQFN